MSRRTRALLSLLPPLLMLGSGCAFSRRENRIVWNAFEEHLVPEDGWAFALALPLTVPGGLLAILADTLVVHPACIVDDAARDCRHLWNGQDLEKAYWTDSGFLPLRAAATPVVFTAAFLARAMFDVEEHGAANEEEIAEQRAKQREAVLAWLRGIAAGGHEAADISLFFREEDPELETAVRDTWRTATAPGRLALFAVAQWQPWVAGPGDWDRGLADASPAVRYRVLQLLPKDVPLSGERRRALLADPDDAVRAAAAEALEQR